MPISIDLNQAKVDNQAIFPEALPVTKTSDITPLQRDSEHINANNDDEDKEGQSPQNIAIPKKKPDLSLRPKLITISKPVSTPRKRNCTKAWYMYAKPSHKQPSRAKKQLSTYLLDSDESSIESDNETKDMDIIPEGISGKYF